MLVDAAHAVSFAEAVLTEATQYLTLCWRPPSSAQARWFDSFVSSSPSSPSRVTQEDLTIFQHTTASFLHTLSPIFPHMHQLDADELCTYLHQTVSWNHYAVFTPELPYDLSSQLPIRRSCQPIRQA